MLKRASKGEYVPLLVTAFSPNELLKPCWAVLVDRAMNESNKAIIREVARLSAYMDQRTFLRRCSSARGGGYAKVALEVFEGVVQFPCFMRDYS